jgi:hypothetical protein
MKLESLAWGFIRAGRYGLFEAFIHDRLSKTWKRASDLRQMVRHDVELLSKACKGPQRSTSLVSLLAFTYPISTLSLSFKAV